MPRLSLLLVPALALACAPPSTTASSPGPSNDRMSFPVATYATTIVDADVPATAPADMRSGLVGRWVIAFGDNGHALASFGGRQVVDAPFTVSGNEITFTADSGEYACGTSGRYTWHATATELHLTRIEDPCDGRAIALTAHALVKQ
jgi:hypothetical protein